MYTASMSPYDFEVFDISGATITRSTPLPGIAWPNNIEVAKDGRIFAGATDFGTFGTYLWIYGLDGSALRSFTGMKSEDRTLSVSGDGLRMITTYPGITFTTVAP